METKFQNDMLLEAKDAQDRFLIFTIDEQNYGIEIQYITEIIEIMPATVVPFLPSCMKGIINLRGSIIPLMDVRLRFGLPEKEYTDQTCIIVLDKDGVSLGLIVDAVQEVTNIPQDLRMPPPLGQGEGSRYINGVANGQGQIQLLLDCDQLMSI